MKSDREHAGVEKHQVPVTLPEVDINKVPEILSLQIDSLNQEENKISEESFQRSSLGKSTG